eukprot:6185175-Pleurochrysis_carterae.AAC.4
MLIIFVSVNAVGNTCLGKCTQSEATHKQRRVLKTKLLLLHMPSVTLEKAPASAKLRPLFSHL